MSLIQLLSKYITQHSLRSNECKTIVILYKFIFLLICVCFFRYMKKMADRIKTIYRHLNPDVVSPNLHAIGMQNPMKVKYIKSYILIAYY